MSPLLEKTRRSRCGAVYTSVAVLAILLAYALVAWVDQSLGELLQ